MNQIQQYLVSNPKFIPAVVGFTIEGRKVLLGLRKKVSFGLGENLISGIGGKVGDLVEHQDESPEDALIREFQEEIDVTPIEYEWRGTVRFIFPHKPKWNQDVQVYVVYQWKGEPRETDVIKPSWFPIDQLPSEQMWDDNAYWLPRILLGENVKAVFLFGENNKVVEYIFE